MPKILPWDVLSNDFQDGLLGFPQFPGRVA